jgi:hypothetical protein
MTSPKIEAMRNTAGRLPAYSDLGGYPIFYVVKDGGVLCPACANGANGSLAAEPEQEDAQWAIVEADIHWEGEAWPCDHCGGDIESAYGEA